MEPDSVIYTLLGRIHVFMRRRLNRITDVEYMRVDLDYAREIVRLAEETGDSEAIGLCARLRAAMALDGDRTQARPRGLGLPGPSAEASNDGARGRYVGSSR